jgi:hypothetical protein
MRAALKKEAVPKLMAEGKVKLRDGAEQFLRGILADGSIKVVRSPPSPSRVWGC